MSLTNVEADPELIRLHFSPGTRAVRVRWVLEEIGVPYQLSVVSLWRGAHKSKDYLKIHPLGKVPALEIDDTIVFESLGICLYLADRFVHADLAPVVTDRKRRADYCTWMAFSAGTLEPAILEQLRAKKAKERGIASIGLGPALTPFDHVASYMEHHLAKRPFLLGDQITAADIMNGMGKGALAVMRLTTKPGQMTLTPIPSFFST
jgi:glutathione S-transferase